jgi:hypothetical protein
MRSVHADKPINKKSGDKESVRFAYLLGSGARSLLFFIHISTNYEWVDRFALEDILFLGPTAIRCSMV